jgi:cytidylate kinase
VIITIDGPAGVGKSSAARDLAARLGFEFLDTGAMYRAVALAVLRAGLSPGDEVGVAGLLPRLRIRVSGGNRILLDDEDVSALIRTAEVTSGASVVAAIPAVRAFLVDLQRQTATGRNVVSEGRDQGTVVFPEAGCKFFLHADSDERARRRQAELEARGVSVSREAVLAEMAERDERDTNRAVGPLRPAADAIVLDSTQLTLDEVVARMEEEVRRRWQPA